MGRERERFFGGGGGGEVWVVFLLELGPEPVDIERGVEGRVEGRGGGWRKGDIIGRFRRQRRTRRREGRCILILIILRPIYQCC